MSTNATLSARASWLFVLGSLAVGIGASYALIGSGVIASAGAYLAIIAVGAFVTTRKTQATTGGAIGRFVLLGIAASIAYFFVVHHAIHAAAMQTTDVDQQSADAAGTVVGGAFGAIVAVATFVETVIASTVGALIGGRK